APRVPRRSRASRAGPRGVGSFAAWNRRVSCLRHRWMLESWYDRDVKPSQCILSVLFSVLALLPRPAHAVAADACEQQRGNFPEKWEDTAHEAPLLSCQGHYINFSLTLRAARPGVSASVLSLRISAKDGKVYRTLVTPAEVAALKGGK